MKRRNGIRVWRARGALAALVGTAVVLGLLPSAQADLSTIMLSESQEVELGRNAAPEVEKELGRYEDPELEAYINKVGQRLVATGEARGYRYTFKIIDRPDVNAFALPGGYIYVFRGLLAMANSEAELAGVLGHEMAHVTQRHIAKALTREVGYSVLTLGIIGLAAANKGTRGDVGAVAATMQGLMTNVMLGFTRDLESEADEVGMRTMARAGYDPRAMVTFMRAMRANERFTGQGFHAFSDHPGTLERIVKADTQAAILRAESDHAWLVRSDEYKAHLDGLRYGDAKDDLKLRIYTVKMGDGSAAAARPASDEGRPTLEISVKSGDTLAQVSRQLLGDTRGAWELAVLNGMREKDPLHPGQRIKVIVHGGKS